MVYSSDLSQDFILEFLNYPRRCKYSKKLRVPLRLGGRYNFYPYLSNYEQNNYCRALNEKMYWLVCFFCQINIDEPPPKKGGLSALNGGAKGSVNIHPRTLKHVILLITGRTRTQNSPFFNFFLCVFLTNFLFKKNIFDPKKNIILFFKHF